MALDKTPGVTPGEHPLMSNRTLRTMYTRMVEARVLLARGRGRKPGIDDIACWVSPLVGLHDDDVVFGCRKDGVLPVARGNSKGKSGQTIVGAVDRLYAAIGAATAVHGDRVVVAFFERHEIERPAWFKGLSMTTELPLILVVLPRWKGKESRIDLCKESRSSGLPGIPVDGHDAVGLYRVAQESLGRARAHGGPALIEGVQYETEGRGGRKHHEPDAAVSTLAAYLLGREIATQGWIDRIVPAFSATID